MAISVTSNDTLRFKETTFHIQNDSGNNLISFSRSSIHSSKETTDAFFQKEISRISSVRDKAIANKSDSAILLKLLLTAAIIAGLVATVIFAGSIPGGLLLGIFITFLIGFSGGCLLNLIWQYDPDSFLRMKVSVLKESIDNSPKFATTLNDFIDQKIAECDKTLQETSSEKTAQKEKDFCLWLKAKLKLTPEKLR